MDYTVDGKVISVEPVDPALSKWDVLLNGEDITDRVETLALRNDNQGVSVLYGKSPTGGPYNQAFLYNRGGAVIGIAARISGKWHAAGLSQRRPLQEPEPIFEFPRGFADMGDLREEDLSTAARELLEETGLEVPTERFVYLGQGNPDNALIMGKTISFWLLLLTEDEVVQTDGKYQIKTDLKKQDAASRLSENILGTQMIAFEDISTASMMTLSALALIRQHIDTLA